ncbi:uncharacterized protein BJ171DRAFT_515625 [Polychytrium aggregatum]|uniref:uncharacterized protein n=1 Tax=Polychytrium aggregatum TaxID=110093 RepID=UPI0022FDC28C|nr:uncharacterized protein BJ171DRAFT_515625 [Polychytrium aggregatum]KAI9202076.1 hypothetical protein BJ171DRAFT_515625 [Polychytrium aggregatum]
MIGAAHPRPKKKYNLYDFDRKPVLEKDIWTDDDVEDICYDDAADPRQCPEYTITYRQRVCSEDIFLGMMGKQNSIEDCNEMVMHVEMPLAVALSDIQVDIKDNCVWVQCPQYKLRADLPVKVDEADSTARWDAVDKRLILTMPIVREFKI